MNDRLTKAWKLRFDLHHIIMLNRDITIAKIFAHFPETCTETIRKALRVLRNDSDVEMTLGRNRVATFRAITTEIRPESEQRIRLDNTLVKDKYEKSYALRQKILEHFEKSGETSSVEVAAAMEISIDHANRACNAMVKEGTLARRGIAKAITYVATGQPLPSAEEMRARVYKLRSDNLREQAQAHKAIGGPGSRVYLGGQLRSTSQGGQGALPMPFGIRASAGML